VGGNLKIARMWEGKTRPNFGAISKNLTSIANISRTDEGIDKRKTARYQLQSLPISTIKNRWTLVH